MATQTAVLTHGDTQYGVWRVITASSVGTMIEWYDFYIFGSLAVYLSPKFYPPGNDTPALIAYLSTFAAGLYYPMIVAAITLVTGSLLLKEGHGTLIWDEYLQAKQP
jgi:hypothetical protein